MSGSGRAVGKSAAHVGPNRAVRRVDWREVEDGGRGWGGFAGGVGGLVELWGVGVGVGGDGG